MEKRDRRHIKKAVRRNGQRCPSSAYFDRKLIKKQLSPWRPLHVFVIIHHVLKLVMFILCIGILHLLHIDILFEAIIIASSLVYLYIHRFSLRSICVTKNIILLNCQNNH